MKHGIVYIISAPSGTGKSTLIKNLIKKEKSLSHNIQHSISYTTRNKRTTEIDGKDYHFVTLQKFKNMMIKNIFFEYTQIFGHYYGTSKEKIEPMLHLGIDIILDIDWKGAQQIKNKIPNAKSIFILPPSIKELKKRLCKRAENSKKSISERMTKAIDEIQHYKEYDYIIINNNLKTSLLNLQSIIISEKLRYTYQKTYLKKLIHKLSHEK